VKECIGAILSGGVLDHALRFLRGKTAKNFIHYPTRASYYLYTTIKNRKVVATNITITNMGGGL
jgi:hypothetical protein